MKILKRLFFGFLLMFFATLQSFSANAWVNDLRGVFLNNSAVIMEVNIRTFNAQDTNRNGIIDFDENEESGNFLNAIGRLDELRIIGVNTIHLLPITPVGKTKALGTAGSLYAASSFDKLNPQLANNKSTLSIEEQARKFVEEAHKRKIRVIFDVPACASYDLFMQRPELFYKDKSGKPIVPSDWTDVRLLNAGTENDINMDVFNIYKGFVDMSLMLGADGIRADVAPLKPAKFWRDLIDYSRTKDPQFLWLAETSDSWTKPVSEYGVYTQYNKLLEAGFDGYYGSYFNLKNWKTSKDFFDNVKPNLTLTERFGQRKSVIGSFTTHDELSPVLINGYMYSNMIMWLNATLPLNSYFVDGFQSGDNYIYFWANKKAPETFTDDEYYFVHRGKIDIFNFSRRPGSKNADLAKDFVLANNFKRSIAPFIINGKFSILKTNNPSVFSYALSYNGSSVIVNGNLNFKDVSVASISVPKIDEKIMAIPVKMSSAPVTEKNKIKVNMYPGEIQVLIVQGLEL